MPQLITDDREFWQKTLSLTRKADEVVGASFGLYAGVTEFKKWYLEKDNNTAAFLEAVSPLTPKLLIGFVDRHECSPGCPHCLEKANKKRHNINATLREWPNIQWKLVKECHAKGLAFRSGKHYAALIGGRNLSDSTWPDYNLLITGQPAKDMYQYFDQLYDQSEALPLPIPDIKSTLDPMPPPACPKCSSLMEKRTNSRSGSEFWGCVRFPDCRGTRKIE